MGGPLYGIVGKVGENIETARCNDCSRCSLTHAIFNMGKVANLRQPFSF